ncbi:hypothetical protein ABZ260_21745 [Streptosporangium sp. NPDC006013]|uniref:hypothetical protein n=1 Tax=Streptosporangium sp. NPDC006013 TaxID=3155596 RepID=UPI0033B2783E
MAGIVAAAGTAALTGYLTSAFDKTLSVVTGTDSKPPLTWTVEINRTPCEGASREYVLPSLPNRPVSGVGMPKPVEQNAPDGGYTDAVITLQGSSGAAVVLHAFRIEMVQRAEPTGVAITKVIQCGGITPRNFTVDLDKPAPRPIPLPGTDEDGNEKDPVRFPFSVSDSDAEIFHIFGATRDCDCRWRILVDWSSQGRKGTATIDDNGLPFRTVGIKGLPGYEVADGPSDTYRWKRRPPAPAPIPLR